MTAKAGYEIGLNVGLQCSELMMAKQHFSQLFPNSDAKEVLEIVDNLRLAVSEETRKIIAEAVGGDEDCNRYVSV